MKRIQKCREVSEFYIIKLGKSDHFNLPEKLFNTIKPKFSNAQESSQLFTKAT